MLRPTSVKTHPVCSRAPHRRGASRGFTLIELSIVVVIVGILAVIAVVGYRKYIQHSKITEAQTMISAIRIAQEDHRAEKGTYADVGPNYCPAGAGVANVKWGWTPGCPGGGTAVNWNALPVHVDGPVLFGYSTQAGGAWVAPADTAWVNWNAPTANPWYVVRARADLDGAPGDFTQLVGSSFTNQIFSRNEGM